MPSAAPICCATLMTPETTPESPEFDSAMAIVVFGTVNVPPEIPSTAMAGKRSTQKLP